MRADTGDPRDSSASKSETARLEAFSDGVFAIAVTLLVLNLTIPDWRGGKLLDAILANWSAYVAYLISFAFILIMWVNHHRFFKLIRYTDHVFLLINGLLLLFVTVIPFPTALVAAAFNATTHPYSTARDQTVAVVIYNGLYFLNALAFNIFWWYASRHRRLLEKDLDARAISATTRRVTIGLILYAFCVALTFLNVWASLALNILLAAYFALPDGSERAAPSTL